MNKKNYMPFFFGNQWIKLKSIRKASTGKEYAKKLAAFLNWIDSKNVVYENAIMYENFCMNSYLAVCGAKRFYHCSRRWDICIDADVGSTLQGLSQMQIRRRKETANEPF